MGSVLEFFISVICCISFFRMISVWRVEDRIMRRYIDLGKFRMDSLCFFDGF